MELDLLQVKAIDEVFDVVQQHEQGCLCKSSRRAAWDRPRLPNPYFNWKAQMKRSKKYEKNVVKVFRTARVRFNKAYRRAQGGLHWTAPVLNPLAAVAGFRKGSITQAEWQEIASVATDGMVDELGDVLILNASGEFAHTIKEVNRAVVQLHAKPIIDSVINGEPPRQALEFLEGYELQLSESTVSRTDARLKNIIRNGLSGGHSNERIRDQIKSHFKQLETREAFMIARTETIRASAQGAKIGYLSTGITHVDVMPAGDACPICVVIANSNPYKVDDAGAYAPFHPNCRCAVSPVVNGKSYYDQDIYPEVYTTGGGNPTFTAQ